jgi:hypothetical protein
MAGSRYAGRGTARYGVAVLTLVLSIAPTVAAQSITDARRVEFTPSTDHNTVDPTSGIALVTNYTLDVFISGSSVAQQTANLGKPTPDVDGMIRLDFVALLPTPLTLGVVYEAVVSAVGPGGAAPSTRSNSFSFSLPCPPTISPTSQSLSGAGATVTVSVTAAAGCAWTAATTSTWITVTTGAAGTASGTVTLNVAANPDPASRTGTVTIGTRTFTVTQAGTPCSFALSPTSQSFAASGGSSTVDVTTAASCTWTATSGSTWATITNGANRTGPGSVGIAAAVNSTTQSRTATLTIAGKSFVVSQQAGTCTYTVAPLTVNVSPGGATGAINVTTLSTCAWTSSSGTSWISLTGSGPGSGTATYNIGANLGTATRTATVTIAGVSVRFDQAILTAPTAPSNLRVIK